MIAVQTNGTTTGNLASVCICKGNKLVAKTVIVASDNRSIQDWLYHYLELYVEKGYAFYFVENESDFAEYAGKTDTVIAFVEDVFFGKKMIGKLDYYHKVYPKLRLVLFSASKLPLNVVASYLHWSDGGYISLRDSEKEIKEVVDALFGKREAIPSYLKDFIDEYDILPDIEPHLTHREIEIIRYIIACMRVKEIASALMLSKRTVDHHISNIYCKFRIRNIVGVLKLALMKGIITVDELLDSSL